MLDKMRSQKEKLKSFFKELKKWDKALLDETFHKKHKEVFQRVDCLQCANCCKTTSPIIEQDDITRISKFLKIPASEFIQKYITMDEDGDFVMQQTPCVFLDDKNYCKIYDARPKACSEYPHTNRKKMYQILDITFENTFVCPAVAEIVAEMRKM
jgi:uncharacterized protein